MHGISHSVWEVVLIRRVVVFIKKPACVQGGRTAEEVMESSCLLSVMLQFVSNQAKELQVMDDRKLLESKLSKCW